MSGDVFSVRARNEMLRPAGRKDEGVLTLRDDFARQDAEFAASVSHLHLGQRVFVRSTNDRGEGTITSIHLAAAYPVWVTLHDGRTDLFLATEVTVLPPSSAIEDVEGWLSA